MQGTNLPTNPAEEISSDLDAIRKLDKAESRFTWSSAFVVVLLLVTLFVALVWFGSVSKQSDIPTLFSESIDFDQSYGGGSWVGTALNQAIRVTMRSSTQVQLINAPVSVQTGDRFGAQLRDTEEQTAQWKLRTVLSSIDSDAIAVQMELFDTTKQGVPLKTSIVGSKNAIADLALRCVEQIYIWLELDQLSSEHISFAKNEIPAPVASEAYGNGLVAMANNDARSALDYFQAALSVTPNNASVLEGVALAWYELGYLSNSIEASKRAFEASTHLTRERQLELEATYAMSSGSWARANQVFSALKEFNPDDLNYRLPHSETLARQNLNEEFLASVDEMRMLPNELSEDPRIDLTEAWYWFNIGDYARCAKLATAAKTKAVRLGNQQIQGEALLSYGRCDDTFDPAVLLEAREIFKQLDISSREPEILREVAKHEYSKGNIKGYTDYLEQAVDLSEALGNEPQLAASNSALSQAYDLRGWLERGLALKQKVAEYQLQRRNLNRYSVLLENIGISLFKLGRYEQALNTIDQAEAVFLDVDDKIGIAWLPYRRGQIALRRGELEKAQGLMQEAHDNAETRPEGNLALESLYELGLIYYHAGDFAKARSTLEETHSKYQELELNLGIAENLLALARLDRQENMIEQASEKLQTAESLLTKEAAYHSLSVASELTVFYSHVDHDSVLERCEQLSQLVQAQEFTEYVLRAKVKLAVCSVVDDSQSPDSALTQLDQLHQQAERLGLLDVVLASHYARAAVLQRSGKFSKAQDILKLAGELADEHEWSSHPLPDLKIQASAVSGVNSGY